MMSTTFDLAIAIGVFLLMPLIIWVNLHNRRVGVMAYLWRESPWLARVGLFFLVLTWLATTIELAAYYGLIAGNAAQVASNALMVPMLALSLAILAMASIVITKYLKSRRAN